jgi:hypothetical protein
MDARTRKTPAGEPDEPIFKLPTLQKRSLLRVSMILFMARNKVGCACDVRVAFTFLDVARTSWIVQTCTRNQKNARSAYDAILRFLPRSIPAMSAIERQTMEDKLRELKNRLQQLGENF